MLVSMPPTAPRSSRSRALRARDAGLRRVSAVTRVAVVGSVAAAGAFTALAAWAQPGHAKAAPASGPISGLANGRTSLATTPSTAGRATESPATIPTTSPATAAPVDNGGNVSNSNLAPPDTLPDPGYQYSGPAVVSGAS